MNHNLFISIDGHGFAAVAFTRETLYTDMSEYTPRLVYCLQAPVVPERLAGTLPGTILAVDDVLEVIRHHLNDVSLRHHELTIGDIEVTWCVYDYQTLYNDLMSNAHNHIA